VLMVTPLPSLWRLSARSQRMSRADPKWESSPSIRRLPSGVARLQQRAGRAFPRCICRAGIGRFSRLRALQSQPHHHASGIAPCPELARICIDRRFWSSRHKRWWVDQGFLEFCGI
jgi:hypothetical protein